MNQKFWLKFIIARLLFFGKSEYILNALKYALAIENVFGSIRAFDTALNDQSFFQYIELIAYILTCHSTIKTQFKNNLKNRNH